MLRARYITDAFRPREGTVANSRQVRTIPGENFAHLGNSRGKRAAESKRAGSPPSFRRTLAHLLIACWPKRKWSSPELATALAKAPTDSPARMTRPIRARRMFQG